MVLAFKQPWNVEVKREHLQRVVAWTLLAAVFAFLSWSIVSRRYAPCRTRTVTSGCNEKPGVATLPVARP